MGADVVGVVGVPVVGVPVVGATVGGVGGSVGAAVVGAADMGSFVNHKNAQRLAPAPDCALVAAHDGRGRFGARELLETF